MNNNQIIIQRRLSLFCSETLRGAQDDLEMGRCMQKLGVLAGDSRDSRGLITFFTDKPEEFLVGPVPKWLFVYDKYEPLQVNSKHFD